MTDMFVDLLYFLPILILLMSYEAICYLFPAASKFERYPRECQMAKLYYAENLQKLSKQDKVEILSFGNYDQITHWFITRKGSHFTLWSHNFNTFSSNSRWLFNHDKARVALEKAQGEIDDYEVLWTKRLPVFPQEQATLLREINLRSPMKR